jgi:uncharacterized protein
MRRIISSSFALITLCLLGLNGCANNNEFLKTSSDELSIADDCRNTNKHFEMDCYDLISYKNSYAQLRLGLNAQLRGDFEEAIQRLNISKQKGNFYANAPLSDIYKSGYGVAINDELAMKLLEETKDIDPIAAYKLYFFYIDRNKVEDAFKLLNFAASNGVKSAQQELSKIYKSGEYIERSTDKSEYWDEQYQDKTDSFTNKIYGI